MGKTHFSNDWIQTADLWCQKRPLYQRSHTAALRNIFLHKSVQNINLVKGPIHLRPTAATATTATTATKPNSSRMQE